MSWTVLGDCNGQPQTCKRCSAEWYYGMARWIIAQRQRSDKDE